MKLRERLFWWALRFAKWIRMSPRTSWACGNRSGYTVNANGYEISITFRDKSQPDGYSREELVKMHKLIQEQEKKMGWRIPDHTTMAQREISNRLRYKIEDMKLQVAGLRTKWATAAELIENKRIVDHLEAMIYFLEEAMKADKDKIPELRRWLLEELEKYKLNQHGQEWLRAVLNKLDSL